MQINITGHQLELYPCRCRIRKYVFLNWLTSSKTRHTSYQTQRKTNKPPPKRRQTRTKFL